MNHPVLLLCLLGGAIHLARLWVQDERAARAGQPNPGGFPGATRAGFRAVAIGAVGALILVAVETLGEHALGIADEQSRITWLFAAYSIVGASVIEELIFRGWLVLDGRGKGVLWGGVIAASAGFALLHPFLWRWDDSGFALTLTPKGAFSTALAFATSLWFYAVRFGPWNPTRSLLPCVAAHAAKNAAVVAVKASGGFVVGLW
jgi:hypothetical protein